MTEREKRKKDRGGIGEDWAVLPFDEEADEARWTQLVEEIEKLEYAVLEAEPVFGPISMETGSSEIYRPDQP